MAYLVDSGSCCRENNRYLAIHAISLTVCINSEKWWKRKTYDVNWRLGECSINCESSSYFWFELHTCNNLGSWSGSRSLHVGTKKSITFFILNYHLGIRFLKSLKMFLFDREQNNHTRTHPGNPSLAAGRLKTIWSHNGFEKGALQPIKLL